MDFFNDFDCLKKSIVFILDKPSQNKQLRERNTQITLEII